MTLPTENRHLNKKRKRESMIKKIEKEVEEIKEWVLPNGYTFLAITSSTWGHFCWAKATDPVTAMRDAYKDYISNVSSRDNKIAVSCFYGKNDGLHASDNGGYQWETSSPPGTYRDVCRIKKLHSSSQKRRL